jgi:hypothetical protein
MNQLYVLEYIPLLQDLDSFLDQLFTHYGFYETDFCTRKQFKKQLLTDYLNNQSEGGLFHD